ncbi:MAG: hypothetical protein RL189_2692 [Pseudomonadota bacterium]|jgi:hypothetical protein
MNRYKELQYPQLTPLPANFNKFCRKSLQLATEKKIQIVP